MLRIKIEILTREMLVFYPLFQCWISVLLLFVVIIVVAATDSFLLFASQ